MTMQHLDTVIAFAFVMLGASLVIVAGTQVAISLLGLRGTNLRRSLADLFETTSADRDATDAHLAGRAMAVEDPAHASYVSSTISSSVKEARSRIRPPTTAQTGAGTGSIRRSESITPRC